MLIYKIFTAGEWADMQAQGRTDGAPIDLKDGYIHFSTADQLRETAEKHFAGIDGLHLVAAEADTLGAALKWEVSRNDALFPHLHREFRMTEVAWDAPLPLEGGVHRFPDEIP